MPRLEKCHSTKKTKTLSRKRLTFCQIPSPRYPPPSPPSSPVWTQYREDYPLEVDLSAQTETLDHYPSLENLSPAYDHLAPLNHSFLDLPRLSREPSFSPVLPGSLLSMGTTQTSLPACSTPVASPTFAVGMSIPKKVTPIFKASPDSSLPGVLKELSSFSPVNCLPYTSRLLDAQKKPSLMPKKEEVLKRKATDLTSLIPLERQLDPETSPPSPKRFKSNEASTQVCATELLPLPLSINDLRNMGLSSVCPGSQALIGSELCPPKCCMCGAPQDWERQRLSQTVCSRCNIRYHSKSPGDRWFDGYDQQPVILFDEFSDYSFSCHQWNGLCDPHPPTLEVKGTKFSNVSSHYVVLSNCCPDDLYPKIKAETRPIWDAFRRRLTDVHHFELTQYNTLDSIRNDLGLLFNTFLSDLF